MKRLSFVFGVALLTFAIGVTATWCCLQFPRLPSNSLFTERTALPSAPTVSLAVQPNGKVEITFQKFIKTEHGSYAKFRVVNGSSEPLYYSGYSRNNHCSYKVKRDTKVEQHKPCWCGTGLEERTLRSGESATYQIEMVGKTGKVQVGFDFEIGQVRRQQTVWSDEVILPNS